MAARIDGIKLNMLNKLVSQCGNRLFHSNPSSTMPWLFIGLGNPGDRYKGTRHNVGFEMIDTFAASQDIRMDSFHFKAVFGKGLVDGVPVLLAKPHTYMNLSGTSSGPLAAYYKLPLNRVLVIHDDMDLPCGVLRLVCEEGHRRHDGLKSVMRHFHTQEFPRLRIGTGSHRRCGDPRAFGLNKFSATEREQIDAGLQEGPDVLKRILSRGVTETAKYLNISQKYKHLRPIQVD